MPWKPKKPCAAVGCGRLTDGRFCVEHERAHHREHDQARSAAQPWRAWYKTAEWLSLRFRRFQSEPLCRLCALQGLITPATVADHIKPHRGDRGLFFDFDNTQSLCSTCHNSAKQSEERRARRKGRA